MNFSPGSKAEALDEDGYWAKCTVLEIVQADDGSGTQFLISFDGWSRQWNRKVMQHEIRPTTVSILIIIYFTVS